MSPLFVLLTVCFALGPTDAWHPYYSSEHEQVMGEVLQGIYQNRDVVFDALKRIEVSNGRETTIRVRPEPAAGEKDPQLFTCDGCLSLVDLVQSVQEVGLDWPDVREEIIQVCVDVLTNMTVRGDVICQGILDIYAPHVFTIIAHKDWEPEQLCLKLLTCEPDEITPAPPAAAHAPKILQVQKKNKPASATLTIAQITDLHMDPQYEEGAATDCKTPVCCRQRYDGTGSARRWGEYTCNLPRRTADLFVQKAATLEPRPEFIIYSGDNPSHAMWEETYQGQLNESIFLTNTLKSHLPAGSKVYPAIGNHEIYPTNLYYMPRQEVKDFNQEFINLWQEMAGFDQASKDTITAAGYYTQLHRPGLRVVNYNSNYGYTFNWYNLINEERSEFGIMLDWFNQTLSDARANSEKVVLIAHHPSGHDMSYYSGPITSVLKQFSDVIVLQVHGHTHLDAFRVAVEAGVAQTVGLVCGTSSTLPYKNPMMRVYTLDASTYELQDYTQYHLNINTQTDAEPELDVQYSCKSEYGMADLSPTAFLDLVTRMKTDDTLFEKFMYNKHGQNGEAVDCDAECKKSELCQLRTVTIEEYRACIKTS